MTYQSYSNIPNRLIDVYVGGVGSPSDNLNDYSSTIYNNFYTWTKPQESKFTYMVVCQGGHGGAGGSAYQSGNAGGGGGGGNGIISRGLIPSFILPKTLYIRPGNGGLGGTGGVSPASGSNGTPGGDSFISVAPTLSSIYSEILTTRNQQTNYVNSFTSKGGTSSTGGVYGFGGFGPSNDNDRVLFSLFINAEQEGSGNTSVRTIANITGDGSDGSITSPLNRNGVAGFGGGGGGGVSGVSAFGSGNLTPFTDNNASSFLPIFSGATSGQDGRGGFGYGLDLCNLMSDNNFNFGDFFTTYSQLGGMGGGGNINGNGGNGGSGGPGCGGGGGGGAIGVGVKGGDGGNGGPGFVIIVSIF